MKEFHIKHDDAAIHLETIHTKFSSLEQIMTVVAREYIRKGKSEELRRLLLRIEAMMT